MVEMVHLAQNLSTNLYEAGLTRFYMNKIVFERYKKLSSFQKYCKKNPQNLESPAVLNWTPHSYQNEAPAFAKDL